MTQPLDCEVLIVGAGPTGLTLGLALAQRGVSVIVAERELEMYPLPRAAHIDHQTVRIFQDLGLAERILGSCRQPARYDFLSASGQVLLRFDGLDRLAAGGWPMANAIHQPSIERALRGALAEQRRCELRSGWRFEALVEQADHVQASFETPAGPRSLRARFVVGADGARSPVRQGLGVDMEDLSFDEPWLVVDVLVRDASRLPDVNLQICDPARPTTCVVMGEGRHRWELMLKPGERAEDLLEDANIARMLEPWNVAGVIELERKAVYRFGARLARQWRKGRVLLAGDAAHQTPPFAGQGLCSGVRDAANLAWKLAAILRNGASPRLLDSYQPEREPNVRAMIEVAVLMGRTVCTTDPQAAAERDQQLLAARASGQSIDTTAPPYPDLLQGCILAGSPAAGAYFPQPLAAGERLDDVLGPGAWLISREPVPPAAADGALRVVAPAELGALAPALEGWLDAHAVPAVLVRPDRYVFGSGRPDALQRSFRAALTDIRSA